MVQEEDRSQGSKKVVYSIKYLVYGIRQKQS